MDTNRYEEGLAVRREVLGSEYVDKAIASTDDFTKPLQDLINEYCWGTVWSRPGLPRKTRSLINLALLTAMSKPDELKLHLRGALNNGCSKEEIMEVLLHTAIYCGMPAAVSSFRTAKAFFKESE
ncbi:MAG: 4-carboxymuconolactone decarboxylase [Deltaproteobacteria bacterium]|nr:4-carboxymuconolactone decarboxylase [Deltaproteobacteria bacterium]